MYTVKSQDHMLDKLWLRPLTASIHIDAFITSNWFKKEPCNARLDLPTSGQQTFGILNH